MKTALELIANERQRQIDQEGYTTEHDDTHVNGALARAAACYAIPKLYRVNRVFGVIGLFPWDRNYWKPVKDDRVRELVKAGALIVAEIERLQRKEENCEA